MTDALLATTNEGTEIQTLPTQVMADMALEENGFTYQSGKKKKVAYTPSEVARAPKAALLAVADARTMQLLSHGKYRGFMLSVQNSLAKKYLRMLEEYLNSWDSRGGPLLLTEDGKRQRRESIEGYTKEVNKRIFRKTAEWLANPVYFDKNNTEIFFELPKTKQWLTTTAKTWLAANPT